MKEIELKDLFIFDLANNHQGDVKHALNIINQVGEVVKKHNVKAAFKFQFRNIETFIHPDFKDKKDIKHIPRFISTALSFEDYKKFQTVFPGEILEFYFFYSHFLHVRTLNQNKRL